MTTANKITLTRIAMIPFFIYFAAQPMLNVEEYKVGIFSFPTCTLIALILFCVASFTDFLDGYVARKYNQVTDFGKFADPLADKLLTAWRGYTDESCFIFAETDGEPHNTITPIARMRDGKYQLDLVLRNNITTPEHPLGVFHPHAKLHHIKKENIGLIEVMGLAVLPSRLKKELFELADALVARTPVSQYPEELQKHAEWAEDILARHPELNGDTVHLILQDEVGHVFAQVLADAGVYKMDEAGRAGFVRFLASVQ